MLLNNSFVLLVIVFSCCYPAGLFFMPFSALYFLSLFGYAAVLRLRNEQNFIYLRGIPF